MVKLQGMNFLGKILLAFALFSGVFLTVARQPVFAIDNCTLQTNTPANGSYFVNPETVRVTSTNVQRDGVSATDGGGDNDYSLHIFDPSVPGSDVYVAITSANLSGGELNLEISAALANMFSRQGDTIADFRLQLERETGLLDALVCSTSVRFQKPVSYSCGNPQTALSRNGDIINLNITVPGGPLNPNQSYAAYIRVPGNLQLTKVPLTFNGSVLTGGVMERWADGNYTLEVGHGDRPLALTLTDHTNCSASFAVNKSSLPEDDDPTDNFPDPETTTPRVTDSILCEQAAASDRDECEKCVSSGNITNPNDADQKFWTAFGCVSTTTEGIVTSFLRIGLGMAGGFVLLSILYGAFLLTTSSGDPKRVQEGQEMVSSAVMGLFFVIFSIIILRFIGVSILQIPGFGT